jgi:hypothetical protein
MNRATPHVRILGTTRGFETEWTEIVESARRWRSYGAPFRVIVQMLSDDYALVGLDEDTVRKIVIGTAAESVARH